MFSKKDIDTFNNNIDNIEQKLLQQQNEKFFPTFKDRKDMENNMFEFLKETKRKIYGGYAVNKHIMQKNKADSFYDLDNEVADIDFYSPDPIEDSIKIATMFLQKGYKNIKASEAQHKETYTVFVEYIKVCDISYVPKNIYNRIPFTEIDNIHYTGPQFIMIDMFRMLTDPLVSGLFRWKKTFPRMCLLQKHYPHPEPKSALTPLTFSKIAEYTFIKNIDNAEEEQKFKYLLTKDDEKQITELLNFSHTQFANNNNLLLHGDYVYNYYLKESKISNHKQVPVLQYDILAFDYVNDTKILLQKLKEKFPNIELTIIEYYPFWMLTGYSCSICYKSYPFINLSHYNNRCLPTKTVDNIKIASYDYLMLTLMVDALKARVVKNMELSNYKNTMISNLIKFKNFYFKDNKKTFLDNTPFQEFIIECSGQVMDPQRELQLSRKEKASKNKIIVWRFDPESDTKSTNVYKFSNSSGNLIRNTKNLKIIL